MKKHITMGEAVLPFRASVSEGQVTLTDAQGYFVVSFTPEQIAAIVRSIAVVSFTPIQIIPIPKGPA